MSTKTMLREVWLPDSDGQRMADNTLQFEWIVTLKEGCEALFVDRDDVFVAGDHLIYPVYPEPGKEREAPRIAPDAYVAFGRPKGHRGSYKVWEEDDIFPQVVFEVWSPSNTQQEMAEKRADYEKYGAEEFYLVYPESNYVEGWVRIDDKLEPIPNTSEWVSPRLGIRFRVRDGVLRVYRPDGTRFLTYVEQFHKANAAETRAGEMERRAKDERTRADEIARVAREVARGADEIEERAEEAERQRAEAERKLVETEQRAALEAQQRADAEQRATGEAQQRAEAEQRAERLAAKLRELGLDPDAQ
jgi:Uma2 family endonuclease